MLQFFVHFKGTLVFGKIGQKAKAFLQLIWLALLAKLIILE